MSYDGSWRNRGISKKRLVNLMAPPARSKVSIPSQLSAFQRGEGGFAEAHRGAWTRSQTITVLEAKAMVRDVQYLYKSLALTDCRTLTPTSSRSRAGGFVELS